MSCFECSILDSRVFGSFNFILSFFFLSRLLCEFKSGYIHFYSQFVGMGRRRKINLFCMYLYFIFSCGFGWLDASFNCSGQVVPSVHFIDRDKLLAGQIINMLPIVPTKTGAV